MCRQDSTVARTRTRTVEEDRDRDQRPDDVGEGRPATDTEADRCPHESPRSADVEAGLPDADAHAERMAPADDTLMGRAAANIGIVTGVLGVLVAVGFVFLPANTLPEKAYVLFACIALSVAAVAGIGAWRSARRFALTATSGCVAVVCLAALSMAPQHDQPSPPTSPTRTSGSASATPSVSPAALPAGSVVFDDNFISNKGGILNEYRHAA
jgi:hypothetical protein